MKHLLLISHLFIVILLFSCRQGIPEIPINYKKCDFTLGDKFENISECFKGLCILSRDTKDIGISDYVAKEINIETNSFIISPLVKLRFDRDHELLGFNAIFSINKKSASTSLKSLVSYIDSVYITDFKKFYNKKGFNQSEGNDTYLKIIRIDSSDINNIVFKYEIECVP